MAKGHWHTSTREHLVYRLLYLLRQAFQYQVIRMVDHVAKLFAAEAAIGMYGVPVLFIHVVAGLYFGVTFAEFNGEFGVTFDVKLVSQGDTGEQKQLFADFENQRILAER